MKIKPRGRFLSVTDIAGRSGLSNTTVRRLILAGEIKGYRLGRQLRVKPADWEEYVEKNRLVPEDELSPRSERILAEVEAGTGGA